MDPNTIGIDVDEPFADIETDNNVVVPENGLQLTDMQLHQLQQAVRPLDDDGNNGIHHYLDACQIIGSFNV